MSITILYITHADQEQARQLCDQLLQERLIACVNYLPVTACYRWLGQLEQGDEIVSLLKTRPELLPQLRTRIEALHPYDTPCIISWSVEANPAYAEWIRAETKQ